MILIADSGSTKTDWCLISDENRTKKIRTSGINPFFQSETEITATLKKELIPQLSKVEPINTVYYYGAGCTGNEINNRIVRSIKCSGIPAPKIEVCSDLLGAARALCGNTEGIAVILGTGSNSCLYNGKEIVRHVAPLGFILGDEGSGAALGKRLVADCLKGILPVGTKEELLEFLQLSETRLLERIYSQPYPNRFLASLAPFIHRNRHKPKIKELIEREFSLFFERNIAFYPSHLTTLHATGSIAYHFAETWRALAPKFGKEMGRILPSPLEGLVLFHQQKQEMP